MPNTSSPTPPTLEQMEAIGRELRRSDTRSAGDRWEALEMSSRTRASAFGLTNYTSDSGDPWGEILLSPAPPPCDVKESAPKTLQIEDQQEIASEALGFLKAADPLAVVVGGAPRNWHYNKPCRDIDIYMGAKSHMSRRETTLWLQSIFHVPVRFRREGYEDTVFEVYHFKYRGLPFDIIFLPVGEKPTEAIQRMNFSFNMCSWTGSETVKTKEFDLYDNWGVIIAQGQNSPTYVSKTKDYFVGKHIVASHKEALDYVATKLK